MSVQEGPVPPRFPLAHRSRSIPAQRSVGWVSPRDITALRAVPESVPGRLECTDPTEGSGETQAPSYICPKAQDGPTSSYKCPFSTRGASRASGVQQRVERLTKDQVLAVIARERERLQMRGMQISAGMDPSHYKKTVRR